MKNLKNKTMEFITSKKHGAVTYLEIALVLIIVIVISAYFKTFMVDTFGSLFTNVGTAITNLFTPVATS